MPSTSLRTSSSPTRSGTTSSGPGIAPIDPSSRPSRSHGGSSAAAATAGIDKAPPSLPAIIIDAGAHEIKIAFSRPGGSTSTRGVDPTSFPPPYISPNLVARSRSSKNPLVGSSLLEDCSDFGSLSLRLPMERGLVTDWAAQKIVWDHAFARALSRPEAGGAFSAREQGGAEELKGGKASRGLLKGRTVIITETYFNLPELEVAFDTLLFQEYAAERVWRVTPAQLVPYAPIFSRPSSSSYGAVDTTEGPSTTTPKRKPVVSGGSSSNGAGGGGGGPSKMHDNNTTRPEAMLVVDVGHSSVNVVPIRGDEAIWSAAMRLDISGRLLTNLLKETVSFRQWDMMDEVFLMGKVKEASCFVAARGGSRILSAVGDGEANRGDGAQGGFLERATRPKETSFAGLVEVMRKAASPRRNPLAQEYVLPDYSSPSTTSSKTSTSRKDDARRFGYVRSGAGSAWALSLAKERRPATPSGSGSISRGEMDEEDAFIADLEKWDALLGTSGEGAEEDEEEEDDENDDDSEDDFVEQLEGRIFKKRKNTTKGKAKKGASKRLRGEGEDDDDDDEAQLLNLGPERFQIPETLFCPGIIGLQQSPLHEVIAASIARCDESWREALWPNIVLVGGGARLKGLQRRLENELRALAPEGVPLSILVPESPELTAVLGGAALASSTPHSAHGKLFSSRLVTKAEWERPSSGPSSAAAASSSGAQKQDKSLVGTELCRARFGTWSGEARRWVEEEERRIMEERRRERERRAAEGSESQSEEGSTDDDDDDDDDEESSQSD